MSSAKEFRDYAEECLGWAKTARSEKERDTFLEMARTWMEAAMLAGDLPPRGHAVLTRQMTQQMTQLYRPPQSAGPFSNSAI